MNPTLVAALIGAAGAILGALTTLFVQSRRLPSDIRLTEAQTEKTQHETSALVIKNLMDEVSRFKAKVAEFEERLTKAEARAANSESRLADAESRATEFRRAVIAIGEGRDQDRLKARSMVTMLVGVIEHLLSCFEHPEVPQDFDRAAIAALISEIIKEYQPEQFVRI